MQDGTQVLAATQKDDFRKPKTGMWQHMAKAKGAGDFGVASSPGKPQRQQHEFWFSKTSSDACGFVGMKRNMGGFVLVSRLKYLKILLT